MKLVVSLLLSCIERYCFSKRYDSRSPLIIAIPTKLLFTSYPRSFNFCNLLPQADNLFFHRYCFNKIILENFFEQVEGKCYKLPLWLSPFLLFFSLLFYFLFIAWESLSHYVTQRRDHVTSNGHVTSHVTRSHGSVGKQCTDQVALV